MNAMVITMVPGRPPKVFLTRERKRIQAMPQSSLF